MELTMTVTEDAAQRLGLIVNQQREDDAQGLRIFARGGGCGCSGPSFAMGIDAPTAEDNVRLDRLHRGRPDAEGRRHRRPERTGRRRLLRLRRGRRPLGPATRSHQRA